MTDTAVAKEILICGMEDYCLLYEVIWSLNTRFPTVSDQAKRGQVASQFARLVSLGEVVLVRIDNRTFTVVDSLDANDLDLSPASPYWSADRVPDRSVRFITTPKGASALSQAAP